MKIDYRAIITASALMMLIQSAMLLDVSGGWSQEGEVTLIMSIPEPVIQMAGDHSVPVLEGWGASSVPGMPEMPQKSMYVPCLNPDDVTITRIRQVGEVSLRLPLPVRPSGQIAARDVVEEGERYEEKGPAWIEGSIVYGRSSFIIIRLSPFSVDGGLLFYPDTLEITLSLGYRPAYERVRVPLDMAQPSEIDPDHGPSPQVWDVGGYQAPSSAPAGGSYHNTVPPTECVIIVGSSQYNSSVQPLARWKTGKGVYTRVVETGWITSRYAGTDTQEEIRMYLQDLYNNEGLKWVVLGGDHGDVPSRLVYVPDGYDDSGSDGSYAASDAYYADLAGSGHSPYDWDGDNDGLFGEYSVDGIDLTAEVYVGRLSATSTAEMTTLVNNILNYERDPPEGSWFNRSVLAGAYSNYDEVNTPTEWNDTTDEADLKEAIRLDFMDNGTKVNYTLYEGAGIWPSRQACNASLTTSNLVAAIDNGASMVNLAGHGSYLGIYRRIWNADTNGNGLCDIGEYSSTAFYSTSVSQSNSDMKPLFYNDACNNGEFDRQANCLTEDILRETGIGAIGSSRVSWYTPHWSKGTDGGTANQGHDYRFWEQMLGKGHHRAGEALYRSKSDYISDRSLSAGTWKNLVQYNLMGDPELPVWTAVPGDLNVTYPTPLSSPGSPTFTVKDGAGNPVPGARVCLMNTSNFFGYAVTDANGQCQITVPSVQQKMNLTVTALDHLPHEEELMVGEDGIKPRIISVAASGNMSTGDGFSISAVLTDNIGVSGAYVEYNWSSASPSMSYNSTMGHSGSDLYRFHGSHPLNSLDPLWYRVLVHDEAENWNVSSWTQVSIVDNDTVTFGEDSSHTAATTGDLYAFAVNISDNIGVIEGRVEYRFGTGPIVNTTMSGGPTAYAADILIPYNSTDTLHYVFRACDDAGNWNSTPQQDVLVLDNDDPILDLDRTPSTGTTGDPFSFNVTASDNIDIGSIRIEYWYGEGPRSNVSSGAETFVYTLDLPENSLDLLHYILNITDTSGNSIATGQKDVVIHDNNLPWLFSDLSGVSPTTGDPFLFEIEAVDNIGVTGVDFFWRVQEGEHVSLEGIFDDINGTWRAVVDLPTDRIGTLGSYVEIEDGAGNKASYHLPNRTVEDNDPPVFVSDGTDMSATSGDSLTFRCTVADNIAIDEVSVRVLTDQNSYPMERVLDTNTFWTALLIPGDLSGNLTYYFVFNDTSGNPAGSSHFRIEVTDDDLPIIQNVSWSDLPTTGDLFEVSVQAEDLVFLAGVEIEYVLPGETGSNIKGMIRADDGYFYQIPIPADRKGELSFRVTAIDGAGNIKRSSMFYLDVLDNDAPVILSHDIPVEGTTGDVFYITFEGEDNIGVHSVSFLLYLPYGNITADISGSEGVYSGSLVLPSDMVGKFPYRLEMADRSENMASLSGNITVVDNDRPTIFMEYPASEKIMGDNIEIRVFSDDNIGVEQVRLFVLISDVNSTLSPDEDGVVLFSLDEAGTYTFSAMAVDGQGNRMWISSFITVLDRTPPTIEAYVPKEGEAGKDITLDASGSVDASGIGNITWKVSGPDGVQDVQDGETVTFIPWVGGEYNITLTVTDTEGNSKREYFTVTVAPAKEKNEDPAKEDEDIMLYLIISGAGLLLLLAILAAFLIARRKRDDAEDKRAPVVVLDEDEDEAWD